MQGKKHPKLKEKFVGMATITYMFIPVKNITHSADRYKGLIDAKVPLKNNSETQVKNNAHFLFTRVWLRSRMFKLERDTIESF